MTSAALCDAVKCNSSGTLRRLLLTPGAPRHPPSSLAPALVQAVHQQCSLDTVAALLEAGADPEQTGALVASCQLGDNPELVRLLLASGASPNQTDQADGKPGLLIAVRNGLMATVRQLLASGADPNLPEPELGWTPLIAAAYADRPDMARLLLDAGANPNVLSSDGTALAMAASLGHERVAAFLLERRADPNICATDDDAEGFGPLAYAVQNNHLGCLERLLRSGAQPDLANALGYTPLILAALGCRDKAAAALLSAGADPNKAEPLHHWTPLITAVHVGARGVVAALLADRRTNINILSDDGTSLAKAAEAGDVAMVISLLSAGADANVADGDGHTPLLWAAQSGNADVVARLLAAGARPEHVNFADQSAVLLATCNGHEAALAALINCPMDPRARARFVRDARQALESSAADRVGRDLRRRLANVLETAQEDVVQNASYDMADKQFASKAGMSVQDSSSSPSMRGTMVRVVTSQTVLPHGYLQEMNIRRDSLTYLNRGHFGFVYRAQRNNGSYLVLKVVSAPFRPNQPGSRALSDGNKREVDVMTSMQHRNIVQFYSSQLVSGSLIICMEYVEGENLRIHREQRNGFSGPQIVNYLRQICDGLNYLHSLDICHRDVKCENIMLQLATDLIKIVDFGLSKRICTFDIYHTGAVGTLFWMAPEVLLEGGVNRRQRRYNPKAADVYSLGCTLHEMCTGLPPLCSGESCAVNYLADICLYHARHRDDPMPIESMRGRVSSQLCSFYAECVIKNPDRRPTISQLLSHAVFQSR